MSPSEAAKTERTPEQKSPDFIQDAEEQAPDTVEAPTVPTPEPVDVLKKVKEEESALQEAATSDAFGKESIEPAPETLRSYTHTSEGDEPAISGVRETPKAKEEGVLKRVWLTLTGKKNDQDAA